MSDNTEEIQNFIQNILTSITTEETNNFLIPPYIPNNNRLLTSVPTRNSLLTSVPTRNSLLTSDLPTHLPTHLPTNHLPTNHLPTNHLLTHLPTHMPTHLPRLVNMENINMLRGIFQIMTTNLEDQIIEQVLQESFNDEQENRSFNKFRVLNIKKKNFDSKDDKMKEFSSCRICFNDYSENEEISELPCKHFFHNECIQEWGKRNPVCPFCEVEIPIVKNLMKEKENKLKTN